jgi:hypothetical protein
VLGGLEFKQSWFHLSGNTSRINGHQGTVACESVIDNAIKKKRPSIIGFEKRVQKDFTGAKI